MEMIAITTSNSTSVKPDFLLCITSGSNEWRSNGNKLWETRLEADRPLPVRELWRSKPDMKIKPREAGAWEALPTTKQPIRPTRSANRNQRERKKQTRVVQKR